MDAVVLSDVPEWLWSLFHTGPERLRAPSALAPVVERWSRSFALGAPAEGLDAEEHLYRGEALKERTERIAPLKALAADVLERARALFSGRDFRLVLADREGVVVDARGGGAFAEDARRLRLIEGACWSEAVRGTNAIGTALAEGRPTVVQGGAHYGRRFRDMVCYAAPVRGPDGEVLGVIDATSYLACADDAIAFAVTATARSIEETLRANAYANAGTRVVRTLARSLERAGGPALLVEAPGKIAKHNEAARNALDGLGTRTAVHEVLGLDWGALVREALVPTPGGRYLEVPSRLGRFRTRAFRIFVEPIETPEHQIIAALVYLEPTAAMGRC